jgi:hypothetical protein
MGVTLLWKRRAHLLAALTLGVTIAVTAWWSYRLLGRSSDFLPWLRTPVLVAGIVAAIAVVVSFRLSRRIALVGGAVALVTALAGPAAYAVQTASEPHTGSIPSAGPASAGGFGGPGGGRGGFPGGGRGGFPGGGLPGDGQAPGGPARGGTDQGRGGGMGGLLNAASVSAEMKALLEQNADDYTWVAAAVGSQSASGYQLATEQPVMAIGGFNGTDPSPTLAQFQEYVAAGKIHYFIGGGGGGFGGRGGGSGSNDSSQIASWVTENFTARTVGNTTVYDLGTGLPGTTA